MRTILKTEKFFRNDKVFVILLIQEPDGLFSTEIYEQSDLIGFTDEEKDEVLQKSRQLIDFEAIVRKVLGK